MNCYIFINQICGLKNNEIVSLEDNCMLIKKRGNQENIVAVVDAKIKVVSAPETMPDKLDDVINKCYSDDYVVQYEHIDKNLYQIFAVNKNTIKQIYTNFSNCKSLNVVPYGSSIRAVINKNYEDLLKNKCVYFVEKFKNGYLLTYLTGNKYSETRQIESASMDVIVSEIKRTEKIFAEDYRKFEKKDPDLILISNDSVLLQELVSQEVYSQEDILSLELSFPFIEGLHCAKFNVNFLLPEEILKQKRKKIFKKNVFYFGLALGFLSMGVLVYGTCFLMNKIAEKRLRRSQIQEKNIYQQLVDVNKQKYTDAIISNNYIKFSNIYLNFIRYLPKKYKIVSFEFNRPLKEEAYFQSVIEPIDSLDKLQIYPRLGLFKDHINKNIIENKSPRQRIKLMLWKTKKEE